jgi:starvation-inducible DNA-binding protein
MDEVNQSLNQFLCDLNVFFRKLQNYHWNIQGESFFRIHEKLEEYYNAVAGEIDEIAEHILINGAQPLGTLKDYLENTKIREAENKKVDRNTVYQSVLSDYGTLYQDIKNIKETADSAGDYSTSSLMDNYILNYGKILWMLNQSK